ncbi:MAG: hypothetical protein KAT43_03130 [Nanoarchaeota archaeon]|nr:hypothetical protein [Nanoarchaeota archaeon]
MGFFDYLWAIVLGIVFGAVGGLYLGTAALGHNYVLLMYRFLVGIIIAMIGGILCFRQIRLTGTVIVVGLCLAVQIIFTILFLLLSIGM